LRRCDDEQALLRGFTEASNEAEKAFGNPALYLEKAIVGGRHIEFQVLVDAWGGSVHLGERECSVQRHHQKLVEESPSPAVDAGTRRDMGTRVASVVAGLGYVNAGTVEFLRDADGSLYFMEMNTRLQVEHPVTEAVTGIDIVREQIRIAANERLGFSQADVTMTGHAIECRLNAEDPDNGFRPSPGTITRFERPEGIRLDTHIGDVAAGGGDGVAIPPYYDSLIGKLIAHGPDRPAAIAAAIAGLSGMRVEGIRTTIGLHLRILANPAFTSGRYDVTLVDSMAPAAEAGPKRRR